MLNELQTEIDYLAAVPSGPGPGLLRAALHDSEPSTESVQRLYKFVAQVALSLSNMRRKDLLYECKKFLTRTIGAEAATQFVRSVKILDDYDPGLINIHDAIKRLEDAGVTFEYSRSLSDQKRIIGIALNWAEPSSKILDHLWFGLALYWHSLLKGMPSDRNFSAIASSAARALRLAICYEANSIPCKLEEPMSFSIEDDLDFRG